MRQQSTKGKIVSSSVFFLGEEATCFHGLNKPHMGAFMSRSRLARLQAHRQMYLFYSMLFHVLLFMGPQVLRSYV